MGPGRPWTHFNGAARRDARKGERYDGDECGDGVTSTEPRVVTRGKKCGVVIAATPALQTSTEPRVVTRGKSARQKREAPQGRTSTEPRVVTRGKSITNTLAAFARSTSTEPRLV